MLHRAGITVLALAGVVAGAARVEAAVPTAVVCVGHPTSVETLAAKEIRRYVYLRTGKLLPVVKLKNGFGDLKAAPEGGLIAVGHACRISSFFKSDADLEKQVKNLAPEQYVLRTIRHEGRPILVVTGSPLYAAYRFAEHLGVRFYLHGDVVPDRQIPLEMPTLNESRKPLFALRGIQPFHDFPEGPDWWNRDGYKAIIGQLPKMGMNFFGLHTYPESHVGPEPLTWIGPAEEIASDGKVRASYPSRHFTTNNAAEAWGYRLTRTGDYVYGAAELFDRDDYGADYMRDTNPWKKAPMSPEQCNALFDRMGEFLGDVFTFAHHVGVKTCIGTETPLIVPTPVKQRLQAAGKNPADPAVVQQLYEGMFQRIAKVHPLDYYWLWTPEGWTWGAVSQQQIDATMADFRAVMAAAKKVKAPFTLATCGWVLGPPQSPALFDDFLPKDMPMSCINRTVGNTPVEPGFANVKGRPKWAIPWMEDDPAMTQPQLWAGRMRCDAADALKYGCTGLMGIHWRTRILAPNVSALAKAAWDQSGWNADAKVVAAGPKPKQPEGAIGGMTAHFPNNPIAGADDATVYQTVRYNMNAYRLDVPNGTYNVTLKLCEPAYAEKGKRVFGAKVQGKPLFEQLDIFAKVGQNRALDITAKDVQVADGRLNIDFIYEVEFPCIAGIAIEGKTAGSNQFPSQPYQRKINCGGPVYKDYEADVATTGAADSPRYLPVGDFYADWARAEFGPEAAGPIAAIFTRLDGHLPRPADWVTGPGSMRPDGAPWEQAQKAYVFVDELAAFRPRIVGPGNLERFDYWLNNFRYMRSMGEVRCVWARYNEALGKVKAEKDPAAQKKLAHELALPARRQLVAAFGELHKHLLATVSNPGEMGNVCNWQQQTLPVMLAGPGQELAKLLGEDLPADAVPSKQYAGQPRLFVPEVRTGIVAGETLKLTVVIVGAKPETADLYWRPLGIGEYAKVPLTHVARGTYAVALPADAVKADFEYYVQATVGGKALVFPPTAPTLNQTVVVSE
jgi:hypothetical protein